MLKKRIVQYLVFTFVAANSIAHANSNSFDIDNFITNGIASESKLDFTQWFSALPIPAESVTEVKKYPNLSAEYATRWTQTIHQQLLKDGQSFLATANGCTNQIQVNVLKPQSKNSAEKKFEEAVVHVVARSCLKNVENDQVARIYLSKDYMFKAFDEVKDYSLNDGTVCQTNKVFMVGTSMACSQLLAHKTSKQIILRSSLVKNDPEADFSLWFKESLVIFQQEGENTSLLVNTYFRSKDLSLIAKKIAVSALTNAQEQSQVTLREMLNINE